MASHGSSNKVKTILIIVLIVMVIGLVLYWILTGGIQRTIAAGNNFSNPIAILFGNGTSTGSFIRLPWQPEMTRGPDISDYVGAADEQKSAADAAYQSDDETRITELASYGAPSPYAGKVMITGDHANALKPGNEYVQVQSNADAPVNVTGWSLQSAVSGLYAFIPPGAPIFIGGVVNSLQNVYLAPGDRATITTGYSPVGASFRESICTGYLSELQQFEPTLIEVCPASSNVLPRTAENLKSYGASCFDYIESVPVCHSAPSSLPASLSSACRSFVSNNLSYNGCVAMYRSREGFSLPSWRLYLGQNREFWNNAHDVLRLLDAQGRVVDVLSY